MNEMVKISKSKLIELLKDCAKLRALEAGGVDNWEWYDESIEQYEKILEEVKDDYLTKYCSEHFKK